MLGFNDGCLFDDRAAELWETHEEIGRVVLNSAVFVMAMSSNYGKSGC